MTRHKWELIGIAIILSATIILLSRKRSEEFQLKHEGVFVIGRLFNSSFGADQGWIYKYEYYYENNKYIRSFSGPIAEEILRDSVLFFRILPKKPEVCRQILNNRVPECYRKIKLENKFWHNIPNCK